MGKSREAKRRTKALLVPLYDPAWFCIEHHQIGCDGRQRSRSDRFAQIERTGVFENGFAKLRKENRVGVFAIANQIALHSRSASLCEISERQKLRLLFLSSPLSLLFLFLLQFSFFSSSSPFPHLVSLYLHRID